MGATSNESHQSNINLILVALASLLAGRYTATSAVGWSGLAVAAASLVASYFAVAAVFPKKSGPKLKKRRR